MNKPIPCIALGILIAPFAWGQTGCEGVPEERRAQCEKVMDCLAIDDGDVRRACIDAAQQEPEAETTPARRIERPLPVEPAPAQRFERPAPAEPARRIERPAPAEPAPARRIERPPPAEAGTPQPARQPARPAPQPAAPAPGPLPAVEAPPPEPRAVPRPRPSRPPAMEEQTYGAERPSEDSAPQPGPSAPPADSFSAEVTRIHQSILERQVIALDQRYLFVSDRATQARLKAGQTVEVERRQSRFRKGRAWRITGPSRYPINAVRIRCETDDIRVDDRRRCAEMLDL